MNYVLTFLVAFGLLMVGCGDRPEKGSPAGRDDNGGNAERQQVLPGGSADIADGRRGEKWILQNRVPLMDTPRDFGDQEAFKQHMLAALSAGTRVEVLEAGDDPWLKVRVASGDADEGLREGWISARNVLNAERAGEQD